MADEKIPEDVEELLAKKKKKLNRKEYYQRCRECCNGMTTLGRLCRKPTALFGYCSLHLNQRPNSDDTKLFNSDLKENIISNRRLKIRSYVKLYI